MYCINKTKLNVIIEIRTLWSQHATWTGMAVKSITLQLPDEEAVVNRLLRNPVDFALALRPFYGARIADEFCDLLTEHLKLAAEFIKATMAGDTEGALHTNKEWYDNADEISTFLGSINPFWNKKSWEMMFHEHLGFVTTLAFTLLNGNYVGNVETYDVFEAEAMEMADMMAEGIIKQFCHCL